MTLRTKYIVAGGSAGLAFVLLLALIVRWIDVLPMLMTLGMVTNADPGRRWMVVLCLISSGILISGSAWGFGMYAQRFSQTSDLIRVRAHSEVTVLLIGSLLVNALLLILHLATSAFMSPFIPR